MKKFTTIHLLFFALVAMSFFQSCKKAKEDVVEPPVPDQTSTQEFDNVAGATGAGWKFINKSETQTATTVGFVNGTGGSAYSGAGFISAGFAANSGAGVISTWAISPKVMLQNGDKISFYTRSINNYSSPPDVYPDRLQLRLALADKDSVGPGTETGLFGISLVDINPGYSSTLPTAYPATWTKFEGTISGLNKPTAGRYAFRYFVEDGGTAGANSNGIHLDKVQYTSVNH
ncbi:MAG: choice-of-anchor J domain-containing protein [Ferruginibacter sp.]|nr:choice-of-anchor J domain-containing protein [Chitinophagaceae bacterium]